MSALKKIFGAGDSRDDEVMYRSEGQSAPSATSTATENVDRDIQSSRDIGTGAQDNPGFVTKATDTSNVQSQFANTSSTTSSSKPPVTYAQESNTQRNTAIAGAGAAGAGAAPAVVYASDRVEGDTKQDDISKATYTERSYPLAESTSTSRTTESRVTELPTGYSRDPNAPGATSRTTESSVAQHPTGYSRDPNAPGATPGDRVPGAFPSEESRDPVSNPDITSSSADRSYGRDAAIAGGATAAAGAVGYGAYSASDSRDAGASRDPVSNPGVTSTTEGRSYGRDAAIAGGATAAAGAAGYGAYSATDTRGTDSQRTTGTRHETGIANVIDPRMQDTDERKVREVESHYSRDAAATGAVAGVGAGAGYTTTRDNNNAYRAAGTDSRQVQEVETHYGRDAAAVGAVTAVGAGAGYTVASSEDNRVHTDTSGHNYLHKKGVEESGEKKQGFFSKAFHGPRKDEEVPIGDSKPSNEIQRSSESTLTGSDRTSELPHDDSGMITLHREGSDPTAPALVVREKPGGGIETVEESN